MSMHPSVPLNRERKKERKCLDRIGDGTCANVIMINQIPTRIAIATDRDMWWWWHAYSMHVHKSYCV